MAAYLKGNYFPNASNATIARLLELYPADPAAGSPFGTGDNFTFTPVYKRLAAFQGDFIFQATRRFLLDQRSGKQVARSFCGWFRFADIGFIADSSHSSQ